MPNAIPQTFEELNEAIDKAVQVYRETKDAHIEKLNKAYEQAIERIVELEEQNDYFRQLCIEAYSAIHPFSGNELEAKLKAVVVGALKFKRPSETTSDPTDWYSRAVKAEKALRTIDNITSMRVSKYLKSESYLEQGLSFEHWQSIKIDEALDTCADVIRVDKGEVQS